MMTALAAILWEIGKSRVGVAIITASVCWNLGYWRGYSHADRSAEIAALKAQVETAKADLTIARTAAAFAAKQAEGLGHAANRYQEKANELEAELAIRPERSACRLSDADARRLREIDAGD